MMQFFHWYRAADGTLWDELTEKARELKESGFTGVWFPPCYKAMDGINDVGYGTYDLFDLGEFDQKGASRPSMGHANNCLKRFMPCKASECRPTPMLS